MSKNHSSAPQNETPVTETPVTDTPVELTEQEIAKAQEIFNQVSNNDVDPESKPVIDLSPVASQLSSALSVDTSKLFVTLPNGTEITQKEYQLMNPVGKKEKITVYDISLIQSMEKIDAFMRGREFLSFGICKELAKIQKNPKLESMGFKTVAEFGKAWKGFESSTVNHYVKIGNSFINDDYTIKTGLPSLSVSHLIELNSLVAENGSIDDIINLYVTGKLVDGMSTKAIREVVRNIKNGTTIEDKSSDTTSDNQEPVATVEKPESSSASSTPVNEVINLEKSFDNKVAIGQVLAHCNSIQAIIEIMDKNEVFTDSIKTSLKALIEDTQRML